MPAVSMSAFEGKAEVDQPFLTESRFKVYAEPSAERLILIWYSSQRTVGSQWFNLRLASGQIEQRRFD